MHPDTKNTHILFTDIQKTLAEHLLGASSSVVYRESLSIALALSRETLNAS